MEAKSEALLAEAAKATRVSAVAAKLAWESEAGLFVDLRTAGSISIEGFERIPSSALARSLAKIEESAKAAGTKDIYFLDISGYQSAVAVNLLKSSPQFSGYNARAIDGGLGEWIADNGPFTTTNAAAESILAKLRSETENETKNEQFLSQFAADMGIAPQAHDMLTLNEETNEVIENPLVLTDTIDREAFRKFTQKIKL